MKQILLLALSIAFLAVGCKDDDETFVLRLDGDNNSAPILEADVYECAVRFNANTTTPYAGMKLTEVEFYLLEKPNTCKVIVYDEGNSSSPGTVLYESGEIISSTDANSWNTHVLPSPIELTGDDLWISIEVSHIQSIRSVGCDQGPAVANGDWILAASLQEWQTLRDFTNNLVDINWNIRGNLVE
jgi:hypothetical protein